MQDPSQSPNAEGLPAALNHTLPPFANGEQIAVVLLTKWLDWVTQKNPDVFVALPMIQRGSVWDANRIANLWDSLLRGMPTGSLTVYRIDVKKEAMARSFGQPRADKMTIEAGSLFLLDGQQRTVAMCLGWKDGMDRRVWVDFGQPGVAGQPFRLRVTTQWQPFGFNQNDQSKRLSRFERRRAREYFDAQSENETKFRGMRDYELPIDETEPYGAAHPLELRRLIQIWQDTAQDMDAWVENTLNLRSFPDAVSKDAIETRIRGFAKALRHLFQTRIALVRVREELVDHDDKDEDENSDPALVVLFERIANGGARLTNSDYVFSLIKHRFPQAHNLVQEIHAEKNVSSLLAENDLVMTAVRLAANTHKHDDGTPFPDNPTPSPKEFGRMLKWKVDGIPEGDFLESALMPLVNRDNPFSLHRAFDDVHQLLEFRESSNSPDPGLPKLAFPLLQRQLVQVLLFWIHLQHRRVISADILRQRFDASRVEMLRFVLFWLLCVDDKEGASKKAFEMLRNDSELELFPGKALYELLCEEDLAVHLQHPDPIERSAISSSTPGQKIQSWGNRFEEKETDTATVRGSQQLYARWFHRKEMLLWLQRKTLVKEFEGIDPLAGREEETPYDYDHICPWADWGKPSYRSKRTALREFCEDWASWIVGNSIGNYRIEDSSSNRSEGDDPAPRKLRLDEMDSIETQTILKNSAITTTETEGWKKCSVAKEDQGQWNEARALAFQEVVETRAFRLFKQYFNEGSFNEWIPAPTEIPA